jgi:hypothetical protein
MDMGMDMGIDVGIIVLSCIVKLSISAEVMLKDDVKKIIVNKTVGFQF